MQDLKKQIDNFLIELEKTPNNIDIRLKLANAYVQIVEHTKAVNEYIKILEIDPNNEEALIQKEIVHGIVKQSQLDIYGCTNTYMDPWN
ncbi:MAG: hypothetical protein DRI86_10150 [Bacteroidetes bacterium]|nr:MAG: hypothetical protein DRI86_10150 [Bacteroidota bacterium]